MQKNKSEENKKLIIGGAYIKGERYKASIIREELEKLQADKHGDVKISFTENTNKGDNNTAPDIFLNKSSTKHSIANIFLKKDVILNDSKAKFIELLVSPIDKAKLKKESSRNLIALSGKNVRTDKRTVYGSGWKETPISKNNTENNTQNTTSEVTTQCKVEKLQEVVSIEDINTDLQHPRVAHINAIGIDANRNLYQGIVDNSNNMIWGPCDETTKMYINEHYYQKPNKDIIRMPMGVPDKDKNLFIEEAKNLQKKEVVSQKDNVESQNQKARPKITWKADPGDPDYTNEFTETLLHEMDEWPANQCKVSKKRKIAYEVQKDGIGIYNIDTKIGHIRKDGSARFFYADYTENDKKLIMADAQKRFAYLDIKEQKSILPDVLKDDKDSKGMGRKV